MFKKILAGMAATAALLVGGASAAFAQESPEPVDVAAEVGSLATEGLSVVSPVILAVAGIAIGLAALVFGVRFVLSAVRNGGRI